MYCVFKDAPVWQQRSKSNLFSFFACNKHIYLTKDNFPLSLHFLPPNSQFFYIFLAWRCGCSETDDMPRVCVWLPLEQPPLHSCVCVRAHKLALGVSAIWHCDGLSWIQRLTRAAVYLFRASYGIEGELGWECWGRVTNMKVNMMYNWHIPDIS